MILTMSSNTSKYIVMHIIVIIHAVDILIMNIVRGNMQTRLMDTQHVTSAI